MNISFFGRKPYWGTENHAHRISTYIRCVQMAEYLGGRFNPESNFENDVCVYTKPLRYKQNPSRVIIGGVRSYMDIVDDTTQLRLLETHPEMTVITCSKNDYTVVQDALPPDTRHIMIPQHHCNFERAKRQRGQVTTVGALGGLLEFPTGFREGLEERGYQFYEYTSFFNRQDVVDFFLGIDIHIVWRPWIVRNKLSNPLKIINSASFGIPTIALYEKTFDEVKGGFVTAKNEWELLRQVDMLASSKDLYSEVSEKGIEIAEQYHIENIGNMYKEL